MQKGKKAAWFGLAVLLVVAGIAGIRAADRQELGVRADASVVSGEPWRASFTAELSEDAVESGALKVTDKDGNPADGTMRLSGGLLEVEGLKPGRYLLHVSGAAFGKRAQGGGETVSFTVREGIAPVSSLEELEEHFRLIAEHQKREIEQERGEVSIETSATSEDSAAGPDGGAGHSVTNNQVSGIDEGDIVKTDGDFLYATTEGALVKIYDIRNEGKPELIATVKGEDSFQPLELYLSGNLLAVVGHQYQATGGVIGGPAEIVPADSSAVGVRLYNVENPANPTLAREYGNEGWHVSSRLNGNILYLVSSMTPIYRIMEQEGDVRPYQYDSARLDTVGPMDTDSITILPGPAGDSYTLITAIDLGGGADASIKTEGFVGSGGGVYMSQENLYLASAEHHANLFAHEETTGRPPESYTKLFKYALDGTKVTFTATGEVRGTPLNQFSMDEYDGHFRIAVTDGNMWDERRPSESAVYVLDSELKETGSVTGLAKGERIYSARFMGERAYVVTFRETDPLFAIDLADPAAPAVLGELKIPGFSNYLHPIGDRYLIGFGQETVTVKGEGPEPQILTAGMKISLFDVSDRASPKEVDVEVIGGRGTYSELQYDHKALFEHQEGGLYGFPVDLYEGTAESEEVRFSGSGAMIYEITPENGIRLQGKFISEDGVDQGYPDYEQRILRIVYAGDTVYTVSPDEVAAYSMDGFRPLGTSSD
ncbi:Secreted protein containing C-terminal beta-propeller domain [Bhargavaea beijingensis]|uniref:Secreted protein containing C-terminal beta-propeller domain n=1 Tax=Bhargavaea beijingensis TaxID=426756 RepID=A0A1G7G3J8_9BACL|nr:beta-propeller domain-containing protein [Bhargavaea beijingensis]SDE82714.1 Secreted protein containing C-terminal beta-propeller domain [Bhargavaea beijingensis]